MAHRVRVWDLPTRLFHWLLVACVTGLVATGYTGGDAMPWHGRLGYAVLALLLFRLAWGFVGGHWSRFRSFLYAPSHVLAYLRGQAHPDHLVGHNPLGAGSVFAMLALLLAQATTGLVSDDEIAFTGPLNRFVSGATAHVATWYHKEVGQRAIITLVLVHLAALAWYTWRKKQRLVGPMLVGDKEVATPAIPSRDDARMRVFALVLLAVCAALVGWIVSLGGGGGGSANFN